MYIITVIVNNNLWIENNIDTEKYVKIIKVIENEYEDEIKDAIIKFLKNLKFDSYKNFDYILNAQDFINDTIEKIINYCEFNHKLDNCFIGTNITITINSMYEYYKE